MMPESDLNEKESLPSKSAVRPRRRGVRSGSASLRSPQAAEVVSTSKPSETWDGQIVLLFAYDIANEIEVEEIQQILGQPVKPYVLEGTRRSPQYLFFQRHPMAQLPTLSLSTAGGTIPLQCQVKILPIGAISLRMSYRFEKKSLSEIEALSEVLSSSTSLARQGVRLAEAIREDLGAHCLGPARRIHPDEPYTVFCLYTPQDRSGFDAHLWLEQHRREVAGLLADEEAVLLSDYEVRERTAKVLQFYREDLAVIDWESALLIDQPSGLEEVLYVLELTNVQWVELEAYDRLLDNALEGAYSVVSGQRIGRLSQEVLRKLREVRIDLAKVHDELSNITRFLGDWYLGRVYAAAASRFQLPHWQSTLNEKLQTVNHVYEILKHERLDRVMLVLEVAIVGLFVLDLIVYLFFH